MGALGTPKPPACLAHRPTHRDRSPSPTAPREPLESARPQQL